VIGACAAAAEELGEARKLVEALEKENGALNRRLETEKRTSALLADLGETRQTESDALQKALAAKNETITAKDETIRMQAALIENLKKKKTSPLKRLGDILLGAAVIAILK
jgi:hypothetical protein